MCKHSTPDWPADWEKLILAQLPGQDLDSKRDKNILIPPLSCFMLCPVPRGIPCSYDLVGTFPPLNDYGQSFLVPLSDFGIGVLGPLLLTLLTCVFMLTFPFLCCQNLSDLLPLVLFNCGRWQLPYLRGTVVSWLGSRVEGLEREAGFAGGSVTLPYNLTISLFETLPCLGFQLGKVKSFLWELVHGSL
jgi:hypothetical protein